MRRLLLTLSLWVIPLVIFCQNPIGLPDITNFTKQVYGAETQNWDIQQDNNGILYFANNKGLLSYDGTYWKLYGLPNRSKVRSVAIGYDHRIYVGGEDEIGYFSPDDHGSLTYHSLKQLVPAKYHGFSDVWDIVSYHQQIFFRSPLYIFGYDGKKITTFLPKGHWRFMGADGDLLVAQDYAGGLLRYRNNQWEPFLSNSALPASSSYLSTALIPFGKDSSLLTTLENGCYIINGNSAQKIHTPALDAISGYRIYSASLVNKNWLVLGTSLNGCFIVDRQGNLIQNLSAREGLQNDNILSIFLDRANNLWLGLDNGIDFIPYNNAIKHIYLTGNNQSSGYATVLYNHQLFFGTGNGVFTTPVTATEDLSFLKQPITAVSHSKGQVWGLSNMGSHLLLGHHEGVFQIENNTAAPIVPANGYWTFAALPGTNPPLVAAGTYNGIALLENKGGSYVQQSCIPGFRLSSRFIAVQDAHTVWTSHPLRGIYRISFNNNGSFVKQYGVQQGLPADTINNFIFSIQNRIVAATEKGVFEYNAAKDVFVPSPDFQRLLPGISIRYLKQDSNGNTWFVHENTLGVIDRSGKQPIVTYLPEFNDKMVSGFENIYPLDEQNIFIGADKGFYHLNYRQYKQRNELLQVHVRMVKAMGLQDSLLFGGYFGEVGEAAAQTQKAIPRINPRLNTLWFEYASPLFGKQSNVEYSCYLEGVDKAWSPWTRKTEKAYPNLPFGTYTFKVKARNNLGNESAVDSYTFVVLHYWYQTWWAVLLYLLIGVALLFALNKWQKKLIEKEQRKHEEEEKRLQYLHQLELDKSEKEIIRLKNEKLEAELALKNRELATSAMDRVQQTELLSKLKTDLKRVTRQYEVEDEDLHDDFKKIMRLLSDKSRNGKDWEQFSMHFDQVHSNFLSRLKEAYPSLSANELKLCAYIKLNLSTKEIANLMNVSVRGIEISRYRLRKKLQIQTEVNLFDFLSKFKS